MPEAKRSRPLSALERARQQAAERAEAYERRQRELKDLAVDYLMAGATLERALEQVEKRMEPLRVEARQAQEKAQRERVGIVARMRELEAPEQEVAERLGISLGEVRRSMTLARSLAEAADHDGDGEGDGGGAGGRGGAGDAGPGSVAGAVPVADGLPGAGEGAPGLDGWGPWNEPEVLQ